EPASRVGRRPSSSSTVSSPAWAKNPKKPLESASAKGSARRCARSVGTRRRCPVGVATQAPVARCRDRGDVARTNVGEKHRGATPRDGSRDALRLLTMDRRTDRVRVLLNPGASRAPQPNALQVLLAEGPAWGLVELAEG